MEEDMKSIAMLPEEIQARILSFLPSSNFDAKSKGCPVHGWTGTDLDVLGDVIQKQNGLLFRDNFLPAAWDVRGARNEAEQVLNEMCRQAGVGGARTVKRDEDSRGDRMCWLQGNQLLPGPLSEAVNALLRLGKDMASWGYETAGRPSIQLAKYPGIGARYVRHTDTSDSAPTRTFTAILYLNPDWNPRTDGGQLCLYTFASRWTPEQKRNLIPADVATQGYLAGEPAVLVAPVANRLVLFDSRMPHEVLPSHAERCALTIWFHKGKDSAAAASGGIKAGVRSGHSAASGRIFVSIAAFRDPETRWTVRDLLAKASRPDLLRIGIVWQVDMAEDAQIMHLPCSPAHKAQIGEIILDYREATGPCKARMLAQKLWAGEDYLLQIDSHMRFCPGWDMQLVEWLTDCERRATYSKAVLSTYPPPFKGCRAAASLPDDDRPTVLHASHFGPEGMLRLVGRRLPEHAAAPLDGSFWAAGFSFSRSQLIQEVPYEELPFLFFGEEQYMLARMWTRGWDMFAPPRSIAFHQWSRKGRNTFQACVPQDVTLKENSQSHVLGFFNDLAGITDAGNVQSTVQYSDSSIVRTIQDLEVHCGVQFSRCCIVDANEEGLQAAVHSKNAKDDGIGL